MTVPFEGFSGVAGISGQSFAIEIAQECLRMRHADFGAFFDKRPGGIVVAVGNELLGVGQFLLHYFCIGSALQLVEKRKPFAGVLVALVGGCLEQS